MCNWGVCVLAWNTNAEFQYNYVNTFKNRTHGVTERVPVKPDHHLDGGGLLDPCHPAVFVTTLLPSCLHTHVDASWGESQVPE